MLRLVVLAALAAALVVAPGAAGQDPEPPVATVDGRAISQRTFDHWFAISVATGSALDAPVLPPGSGAYARFRDQTMQLLLRMRWIAGEAALQGVRVSDRAVHRRFVRQRKASFDTWREYRRYLRRSRQTTKDVLRRVRADLQATRIRERVTADVDGARAQQRALDRFIEDFEKRWRAVTVCAEGYVVSDCGNAPDD